MLNGDATNTIERISYGLYLIQDIAGIAAHGSRDFKYTYRIRAAKLSMPRTSYQLIK